MASLLRNVGVNLLGFLAGKVAAAVTGILLLRALRPEAAGIYTAALGFAGLFQCVADLGLSACLTKEVSAHPAQASRAFSLGLQAQALQIVIAALGLALFLRLGGARTAEPWLVLLAFALMSLSSLAAPVLAVLQGQERFGLQGALATLASLANATALGLVLWLGQASPDRAMEALIVAGILGLSLWCWGAWSAGLRFRWQAWSGVLGLWRRSLPFAMVSISNQLYVRIDQVLLAWLVAPAALGLYGGAVKLVDLMVPVLGALNGPLYARLAGLHGRAAKGDKAAGTQAWGNLNRALRFMALLCLPLGIGGSVLAAPLCALALGPDYAGSVAALACLVWVPALIGIHSCLFHGLNAVGRTLSLTPVFGANLILNVGLNLWLIPRYGIVASAAISVLCESVNLGAAWWLARGAGLAPSLKAAFWPALPAGLGMGGVLLWARSLDGVGPGSAPLWVALGALVYAVLLLALGFLGPDERAQLKRLLRRA